MVRAQIALNQKDPVKAIELLEVDEPYELGTSDALTYTRALGPVFVHGEALEAAHLDLARAYAMSGDTAKARAAYNDFFTLWKDADPDIPILKRAKAEYAKLR